jgi:hypothetical protein
MPNWEFLRRTGHVGSTESARGIERISNNDPSGSRSGGERESWNRLFGSDQEGQLSGDSTLPVYGQPQEAPTKKQRDQLYSMAGLQFAGPKRGFRERLADRLGWGKDDEQHPIHRKRVEEAKTKIIEEQSRGTNGGWNPQGQASRSDAPPAYGPSPERRE